ncbi:MAG: YARHG domain-containing protein [Bacteroidetes bacterium]|nr:YARHG domain-containing protein [Bacteroidota bacterium]
MNKQIMTFVLCMGLLAACKNNNETKCGNDLALQKTQLDKNKTGENINTASLEINREGDIAKLYSGNSPDVVNAINSKKLQLHKKRLTPGYYPEASERILTDHDVQYLTAWGYKVMLNEIYARHGMVFRDEYLQRHFNDQKWYHPKTNNVYKQLTTTEKQNIAFLINAMDNETRLALK